MAILGGVRRLVLFAAVAAVVVAVRQYRQRVRHALLLLRAWVLSRGLPVRFSPAQSDMGRLESFLPAAHARHGPVFLAMVGDEPYVFLGSSRLMADLAAIENRDSLRSCFPNTPFGEKAVNNSHGALHKWQRGVIRRHVGPAQVRALSSTMHEVFRDAMREWAEHGDFVDVVEELRRLVLKVMVVVLLGREVSADAAVWQNLLDLEASLGPGIFAAKGSAARRTLDESLRALGNIAQSEWAKRQRDAERQRGAAESDAAAKAPAGDCDVLHSMMTGYEEHGAGMTAKDVELQLAFLIFASVASTKGLLASVLGYLHLRPDLHKRVRNEALHLAEGNAQTPRAGEGSPATQVHGPLATAFVKEVTRHRGWAGFSFRKATADVRLSGGYVVPKGATVACSLRVIAQDAAGPYREPDVFDPDRFLPPRNEGADLKRADFAMPMFGHGAHGCPGEPLVKGVAVTLLELMCLGYRAIPENTDLPTKSYSSSAHCKAHGMRYKFEKLV